MTDSKTFDVPGNRIARNILPHEVN